MTPAEWRFSAQLAWQDLFVRWATCIGLALAVFTSVFVLYKLVPEGIRSGVVTMHYTIYLGIDDVRPWPWVFVIPGIFVGVFLVNISISFGIYRTDKLASRALAGLTAAVLLIASISSFFLVLINV